MNYALRLSESEVLRYRVMAERAVARELHLWRAAGIRDGANVADVGCGPGAVLLRLAEQVGGAGSVIGVDADERAVESAIAAIHGADLPNVTVRAGAADNTGLPFGSFDVVVMRHVLAHNGANAQEIVEHLARLLLPGGAVYLVDVDMSVLTVRPTAPVLDAMFLRYKEWHAKQGNDLRTGRYLQDLARSAGLEIVAAEEWTESVSLPPGMYGPPWAARHQMLADGLVSAGELGTCSEQLAEVDRWAERPTVSLPTFAVVARRES